jgi:D-amino-acid dehydrogenase
MTRDGMPVIGPTKIAGLLLNNGHGTLGWTASRVSARVVSHLIRGRELELEAQDLSVARYA